MRGRQRKWVNFGVGGLGGIFDVETKYKDGYPASKK
jgi:hypothetical protein